MRANKQPFVRFFASDWLAGTRGMTAEETGIYITLIAMMYERCEPLPEDAQRLSRQCGCTKRRFEAALQMLVDDGKVTRFNGHLWNDRVQKEFDFRSEKSQKSKQAVAVREKKRKENNGGPDRAINERSSIPYSRSHIPETKDKNKGADAPGRYAFEGEVVRLTRKDFASWSKAYCGNDDDILTALLQSRDDYLANDPEVTDQGRKRWFMSTSSWLRGRRERGADKPREDTLSTHMKIDDALNVGRA